MTTTLASSAHAAIVTEAGGRYPWKPSCTCGWSTWGYVAEHAAQLVADSHVLEAELAEPQVFGPGRPAAARAAIAELEQALAARDAAGGGWAPNPFHRRVLAARLTRAQYAEYGD